jgi:small subunit ribosomal protein S16
LLRGVKLGLFDEPTAFQKFEQWQAEHEQKVAARRDSKKPARAVQPIIKRVEDAPAQSEGSTEA